MKYDTLQAAVEARIKAAKGLRSLARHLRISPSYISKMATGKRVDPTDETLAKLGLVRKTVYVDQKEA